MLEGISDTWSRPDANNNVNYANIPPGRYSFRVKAFKSPDDVVGVEGESFSFRVRPPVWRRWWAIAAYFVFSAFCMFMIYEVRNKRLQLERVEKDHKETIRKILNSQLAFPDEKERSSPDERFLKKLYEVMRNNLSSSGLNTEYLCSEIGVSRTNLYYKLKSLTGLSPTEFIRNHRVQLAARLLVEKRVPVSEVYEMVGFNSHPYFCSCFKKVMGCSPTEYIRRNKN
jgi:AraC-like DNA-binding protein